MAASDMGRDPFGVRWLGKTYTAADALSRGSQNRLITKCGNGNLLDMIERISHMDAAYGLDKISLEEAEGMWRSAA